MATAILALASQSIAAEDWSQYESGRDNIRLDGYQGQPGYIAFYDGNGNVIGYLYASEGRLFWVTPGSFTANSGSAFGTDRVDDASHASRLDGTKVDNP
jgi:hypothetical protein